MEIVAKNKFDKTIYDKVLKGTTSIEIHLDEDFIHGPIPWDEQILRDVKIAAVHAPLIQGDNDTNIEVFNNRKTLIKTCDFAEKIADTQGHLVTVVCHLGTDPDVLRELGLYKSLIFFIRELADTYEQLEFAIENVTPWDNKTSNFNGHVGFRAIQFDSSVRFVKDVNHPRVGTCLDTCHAMMMVDLLKSMSNYLCLQRNQYCDVLNLGIESFFSANQDTIKWLHLANAKTHGLGANHGLPFTSDDREELANILNLYKKYKYSCPVSLEVRELDYSDAKNFSTTYATLLTVLKDQENC